jgi:Fic family protein
MGEDSSSDRKGAQTENAAQLKTEHKRNTDSGLVSSGADSSSDQNGAQLEHIQKRVAIHFRELSSNSKKIVLAFYKNMKKLKSLHTEELTIQYIQFISGVEKNSIKTTLRRLVSNGVLNRVERKDGRGGWVKYALSQTIFNEIEQ